MYFTHKFLDEDAHEGTIKSNTIDMMEGYVLRVIRESYDNLEMSPPHGVAERIDTRIRTWVNENYTTADMADMADFLSLIVDEEIK